MKLLLLADTEAKTFYDYYTPGKLAGYDLILACGDLKAEYLEFLVTLAHCPLVYVRGNHDDSFEQHPPGGCDCADDRLLTVKGLRIVGLGGSYRYRDGKYMYTEEEMARRVRRLRRDIRRAGGFDILLTHAPAQGLNDLDTLSHQGFACFRRLIEEYHPRLFAHGHVHLNYTLGVPQKDRLGDTLVVNAYEYCELNWPEDLLPVPEAEDPAVFRPEAPAPAKPGVSSFFRKRSHS